MASSYSFLERFNEMVAALRAHPKVKVFKAVVKKPATAAALAAAEKAIVRPLPADVRAFYEAHDGVFLEWGLKEQSYMAKTPPFKYPDYGQPPGCINLLPVKSALSASWQRDSHINTVFPEQQKRLFGKNLAEQPKTPAVCIDNYSKYNHADLIFGALTDEPLIVVATDHGADITSSHFLPFSLYLDVTLSLFGLDRYQQGLGCSFASKAKRIKEWTKKSELDVLVKKLEKEAKEG